MVLALSCILYASQNRPLNIINWLVFITVEESVYSAVRTDSLHKADYSSPFIGGINGIKW